MLGHWPKARSGAADLQLASSLVLVALFWWGTAWMKQTELSEECLGNQMMYAYDEYTTAKKGFICLSDLISCIQLLKFGEIWIPAKM